ncbi:M15 family metallopeptidase [Tetragenococcus koreensis]|uniref:M15 family metallopeptidase n=1 Tax=Tetragenococcus koreensis TaxID=290335 RepID=UPI001F164835|nr:M15 family metallopeptidase [Tetragenococcus koreensis]MCF1584504.1 M15 family metallopeptidase [Tetragenococcus koreensis]MCF1614053.1 M15 family metallopeptidase [Tetragenococcus koreensis]MCF1616563.1 M15 family metallopeptidase [Tetragenococcus koreensis]MCF1621533.1 M15 family metallopeptidase [Tetragenococcus koreensis]MCF1623831.1 M15 family metallopeptidase [Tetragenococcus koreensis]
MKRHLKIILLGIVGIGLIVSINRFVTKKVADPDKQEVVAEKTATDSEEKPKAQDELPDVSSKDWSLVLVGPDNPLEKEISSDQLSYIPNTNMQLDKRVVEPYEQLSEAAQKAGYPLVIISAYRSVNYQEQVFDGRVAQYENQGMDEKQAKKKTKETSTEPGHSEHHTGLALDIVDENWQQSNPQNVLEADFGKEDSAKWLAEHASDYGFILRYPKGKEENTKINYEPWHFRYVGKENAKYMEKHELTLEEFLDQLNEK